MRQIFLILVLAVFGSVSVTAEVKVTRDVSIAQLEVFDQYIGDWKYSMKSTDGVTMAGDIKTEWIHGGRLIRQSWTMEPTAGRPGASGENVMTYDVHQNAYRQWSFGSFGVTTVSTGKWDKEKKLMLWTGQDSLGNAAITRSHFTDKNNEQFTIVVKNADGETLAEITGTTTRE